MLLKSLTHICSLPSQRWSPGGWALLLLSQPQAPCHWLPLGGRGGHQHTRGTSLRWEGGLLRGSVLTVIVAVLTCTVLAEVAFLYDDHHWWFNSLPWIHLSLGTSTLCPLRPRGFWLFLVTRCPTVHCGFCSSLKSSLNFLPLTHWVYFFCFLASSLRNAAVS